MKTFFTNRKIITISATTILLLIWKLVSLLVKSEIIIPSPEKTILTLITLSSGTTFWICVFSTVLRGVTGFILSFMVALPLGIISGFNDIVKAFLQPAIIVLRSTPVVAFILMALIWFSPDKLPVFIAFLTMFPLIYTNIAEGVKNVDSRFMEMARIYRLSFYKTVKGIYIPSIMPFLFSGVSSALGFGWRAIIVGEVLSQPRFGIGSQMQNAQIYLLVPNIIAWTIVAVLVSYFFEKLIHFIERKIIKWRI
jgi:NitT/TauT family transport system permease protein